MSTPASFSRVAELKGENPPVVVYIEGVPLDSDSYDVTVAATDFADTSYKTTFQLSEWEKSLVQINPGSSAGVIEWLQDALDHETLVLKHVDGDRARSYFQATYTLDEHCRVPLRLPPNTGDYLSHQQGAQAHLTAHALGTSLAHSFNQLCKQHARDQSTIAALRTELQGERSDKASLMNELRIVAREKDLAGSTPAGKALHSRLAREPGPPVPLELLPSAASPAPDAQTSSAIPAAPPTAAPPPPAAAAAPASGANAAAGGASGMPSGSGADAAAGEAVNGGAEMDEEERAAYEMIMERQRLKAQQVAKPGGRHKRTAGGALKGVRPK